ncbi:DNA primase, partial [Chryseobacterium sp. HMWF001]
IYSELNDWTTRNIFSPNYGDKIPEQVAGDILIHKFRYVNFLISKAKGELAEYAESDESKYFEQLKKIQMLTMVSKELAKILNYSAITGIYTDR